MRTSLFILFFAIICGCASPKKSNYTEYFSSESTLTQDSTVYLKVGKSKVISKGLVDYDAAGISTGNALYPGDTAGLFLVSILAHAATVESIKNNKKKQLQDKADHAVLPAIEILSNITNSELAERVLTKIQDENTRHIRMYSDIDNPTGWILESKPEIFLTTDQTAILVRNEVSIHSGSQTAKNVYENMLESQSDACTKHDTENCWLGNDGVELVNQSVDLYAETVQLALADAQNKLFDKNRKEETFTYYQGKSKTYTRGKKVIERCDRITIRTLRGWLKTVPVDSKKNPISEQDCRQSIIGDMTLTDFN